MHSATEAQIQCIHELRAILAKQVLATGDVDGRLHEEFERLVEQTGYAEELDRDE